MNQKRNAQQQMTKDAKSPLVNPSVVQKVERKGSSKLMGSLVVVPDKSALAQANEVTREMEGTHSFGAAQEATGGRGVHGLMALGMRKLTYRMYFVTGCMLLVDMLARLRCQEGSVCGTRGMFTRAGCSERAPTQATAQRRHER